jgi:hypothetical protein
MASEPEAPVQPIELVSARRTPLSGPLRGAVALVVQPAAQALAVALGEEALSAVSSAASVPPCVPEPPEPVRQACLRPACLCKVQVLYS